MTSYNYGSISLKKNGGMPIKKKNIDRKAGAGKNAKKGTLSSREAEQKLAKIACRSL
jgi:hypothetical protein